MASTKKSSKESIKEYVIIAAGVLLILSMVLCTCVSTSPNRDKSQEGALGVISEPETSSTDPENSAVYENRKPGDEGSKEAGTPIPVEQLDDIIGAEHTSTSLDMYAQDEHSNSSTKEGKKEMSDDMYKAKHAVIVAEKEHSKQVDILNELDNAADCAHKTFLRNEDKLKDAKVQCDNYINTYKQTHEKIMALKKEVTACYKNPNSITRIPEGEDTEYDTEMEEIDRLYARANQIKEDQKIKENIYNGALTYMGELKQNMKRSRKNTLEYYLHKKEVEEKLIYNIQCFSDFFRTIYAWDKLLYSVRKKEALYNNIENEGRAKHLKNIIELHEKIAHNVNDGINIIIDMHMAQKDVIYATKQVYSAYKTYDAAACKYEQQQKLRRYDSSVS
ncbi:hypothetical protein NERG_01744 [Nematocida ausubeli]|uniref:Uncharacterized protein n=1 Tax=Nematocida ausubeli (strain ATCC PRA-371 / ERTm2) TaxID=1913371 RepID=H8ZDS3_NEMA1|nr:hypothetical protein NERG_01744 [Nematocida ausubeli]